MDEVKGGRAGKTPLREAGGAHLVQEKVRKGGREQEMGCHRERATESAELKHGEGREVISSALCQLRNPLD